MLWRGGESATERQAVNSGGAAGAIARAAAGNGVPYDRLLNGIRRFGRRRYSAAARVLSSIIDITAPTTLSAPDAIWLTVASSM